MAAVLAAALLLVVYGAVIQLLAALPATAAAESLSDDNPRTAARFWLAVCLFPPVAAALLTTISLIAPSTSAISPHLERIRSHFCWRSLTQGPDATWHFRVAGALAAAVIVFALCRFVWRWISSRRVEELAARMLTDNDESRVLVARSEEDFSFTVGVREGFVVVSRGLADRLTEEQLRALLAHEQGHVERKDNMWHLIVELAATLALPMPLGFVYAHRWRAAAEADCDSRAAEASSKETVSQLLLMLQEQALQPQPSLPAGLTPVYHGSISPSHRASRLSRSPRPLVAPPLAVVLVAELGVVVAGTVLARRWLWDSFYCAGESLLRVMAGG